MEIIKVENLNFTYPNTDKKALRDINLSIEKGEFVTLCGKSGCGKTTLLRLFKTAISPFGEMTGKVYFDKEELSSIDARVQCEKIGFVMQSPDNQIVTDKVWHELAFGLESLGYSNQVIRARVSEMASFFGINNWFYKKVTGLSGGQKQLLNLASVMVMQPSVLILDEPTSQLDPIAAGEFLKTLEKINRELGVTVILSEHRLEDAFPISDRVIVMDEGSIVADAQPIKIGKILKDNNHDMYNALPTPMKVCAAIERSNSCPLTVRDGRVWLEEYAKDKTLHTDLISEDKICDGEVIIEVKDAFFRYEKEEPDVIKGLNLEIKRGELFAILGGNGAGKTTALSLICGLNTPYRGDVLINGHNIKKNTDLCGKTISVLAQNVQNVFLKKSVYLDLMEALSDRNFTKGEKDEKVMEVATLCRIENLLSSHPYDLSGGEQQRAALAKVLLSESEILLLDEPTKGMDAHFKEEFECILNDLLEKGVTIVMVSHDIEFCARCCDRCALVFDGAITSVGTPREFFRGNNFYTTSANRMARTTIPDAVIAEDIIAACTGKAVKKEQKRTVKKVFPKNEGEKETCEKKKLSPLRVLWGSVFVLLFVLTSLYSAFGNGLPDFTVESVSKVKPIHMILIIEIALAFLCLFPQKGVGIETSRPLKRDAKGRKRTIAAVLLLFILIPLTIYFGVAFLGGKKYYFISLLIILETMIPFYMIFEARKPKARELVIISALCAIAIGGRTAFFMLPQFKPVVALVIVSGICFGGEVGFLIGAMTGFVSNFFFGQGPWTPWQMFAFGIIGFFAGVIFSKGFIGKTKTSLCIFGFLATFILYGGVVNLSAVAMVSGDITWARILSAYVVAIPFDLVHAFSTAFFLYFISEPMIEKIERVKLKYGLV